MKIAILGFGKEGESAFRYWGRQSNDITIHDNDLNKETPEGVKTVLGNEALQNLDDYGYDLIVRSPGLRINDVLNTPLTTPTEEFMQRCPAPIIGVTGTKGKGTTATLIAEILSGAGKRVHLLGNIGIPALDELGKIKPTDVVVFEMSSFQLFDINISPHIAVCLMVAEDHLDWHKDLSEYHNAKGNIFKYQKSDDTAIYYADNKISTQLAQLSQATYKISYGEGGDVYVKDGKIFGFNRVIADVAEVALPGAHNLQNVCAAIAASWEYNQDETVIQKVLKEFKGLPYHIELVAEKNGIKFYNDSFSTNPTSAIAAVESFVDPLVLFLGGFDKQADFSELAEVIKNHQIRKVITYAETGQRIAETLANHDVANVEYMPEDDFDVIVKAGIASAMPGDIVLLSPACASWGMFTDYKARGQQFNNIIENT